MFQQQDTLQHVQQPVEAELTETTETAGQAADETGQTEEQVEEQAPPAHYHALRPVSNRSAAELMDSTVQGALRLDQPQDALTADTAKAPGWAILRDTTDHHALPRFSRELFFGKDTLFNRELTGIRYGVAGDPKPYSFRNDDIVTGLLLACFVLMIFSLSRLRFFIFRQLKGFFRVPHSENTTPMTETTTEFRYQFFQAFLTCLLWSLLCFIYVHERVADTFMLDTPYHLILIFLGCFVAYFIVKGLLYSVVNWTFFDKKKNEQWMKSQLFLTAMSGILLFPFVMLLSYFNFPLQSAIISVAIVLIIVKMLTLYKSIVIFFRQNGVIVQFFLYFCTLEIIPLLGLTATLMIIVDNLKLNF